jgi:hypothetical protein
MELSKSTLFDISLNKILGGKWKWLQKENEYFLE